METTRHARAVVIGASLAGLLAAQALHGSFEEVLVLDRDTLPDGPEPRRGVPQSGQVHGLLARGREELDELLEGLSDELIEIGAPTFDVQDKMQWWGAYLARLRAAAAEDPVLATAFLRVTHLMDTPAALFAPEIAARVPA